MLFTSAIRHFVAVAFLSYFNHFLYFFTLGSLEISSGSFLVLGFSYLFVCDLKKKKKIQ